MIHGNGHLPQGGIAGNGRIPPAAGPAVPAVPAVPAAAAAPGAPLAGRTRPIPTDFGLSVAGRGMVRVEDETAKKAHIAFTEFKELLIQKMIQDGVTGVAQPATDAEFDAIRVNIDFGTFQANVTLPNGTRFPVFLGHLGDRSSVTTLDSRVYNAAYNFQGIYTAENLVAERAHSCMYDDDEGDFEDVLGDYRGQNGLQQTYRGMQEGCREKLQGIRENAIVDGILETAGFPAGSHGAKQAARNEIMNNYARMLARHAEVKTKYQLALDTLEGWEQAGVGQNGQPLTPAGLKDTQSDIQILKEKMNEITLTPSDKRTLLLTLTAEHLTRGLPTPHERAEAAQELLETYLDQTLELGAVKTDPTTKRATRSFNMHYKQYTVMIAAAAAYSTKSDNDNACGRAYSKSSRSEYQKFLRGHKIDPRRHLGAIGAMLRLEGDENKGNPDMHGMDRNLRRLYMPKGLSAACKEGCRDYLAKVADTRHHYTRRASGVTPQAAWDNAKNTVYANGYMHMPRGARF